jgi:hypothetical protein
MAFSPTHPQLALLSGSEQSSADGENTADTVYIDPPPASFRPIAQFLPTPLETLECPEISDPSVETMIGPLQDR